MGRPQRSDASDAPEIRSKQQHQNTNSRVAHPICGIKHHELSPVHHWYKGRIVSRGDQVRDAEGNAIIFGAEDTATTLMGLVGLSATLFYGPRPGNCTSSADAVQAYLQAPIGKETWVIIPFELWCLHGRIRTTLAQSSW